jgi:hypothetical protein
MDTTHAACSGTDCERALDHTHCRLTMHDPAGTRRAYECPCGAVTVTRRRAPRQSVENEPEGRR